jgi:hypothetical protein
LRASSTCDVRGINCGRDSRGIDNSGMWIRGQLLGSGDSGNQRREGAVSAPYCVNDDC